MEEAFSDYEDKEFSIQRTELPVLGGEVMFYKFQPLVKIFLGAFHIFIGPHVRCRD